MKKVFVMVALVIILMGVTFLFGVKNADEAKTYLMDIPMITGKKEEKKKEDVSVILDMRVDNDEILYLKVDKTYQRFDNIEKVRNWLNVNTEACWAVNNDSLIYIKKTGEYGAYGIEEGKFVELKLM